MAVTPKLVDLCKILCASTGTGAITLGDAAPGYRGREVLQNGETYPYSIQQESNFEYGTGVYLAASSQFVRTPDASSNGGAPIDLAPNAMIAFVARAEDLGRGEPGPPGPPGSSIPTLTALKGTDVSTAQVIYDGAVFSWTIADFTGRQDDVNIIGSNLQPLTVGAWVRQAATAIRTADNQTVQQALDNIQTQLSTVFAVPESYGAVGYLTAAAALAGSDYSSQLQAMATDAAAKGLAINGNGRWYKASTVSWPSGSYVQNLKIVVPNATTDNAPFFVDGQSSAKSNITFIDCEVDGNRVGQTNLASSGGDGQRAGFKLFGHTANIQMIRCRAWNCATDGFFIWTGSVVPATADDILHDGLLIQDCDAQWNGRHGISLSSHKNTQIIGGRYKNNGKDAPGWTPSGTFSDGGYGRRYAGAKFGRGVTHEGYFLGEHYENWTIINCDVTENWMGALFYAVMYATIRSHKNLRISGSIFDDPNGGGGDGCLILYAVLDDGAGNRTPYTGTDAFDGVFLENNIYRRNYVSMRSMKNWSISGRAEMDPLVSTYKLDLSYHGPADKIDISGNGTINGYVLPFTVTYDYGNWTLGSATAVVQFPIFAGKHRVRFTTTSKMPGNLANNFQTITLSAGWVFDTYPTPDGRDIPTGGPLGKGVAYINDNVGANSAYMVVPADGTSNNAAVVWEPTIKALGT